MADVREFWAYATSGAEATAYFFAYFWLSTAVLLGLLLVVLMELRTRRDLRRLRVSWDAAVTEQNTFNEMLGLALTGKGQQLAALRDRLGRLESRQSSPHCVPTSGMADRPA